jgi:hypothetical protein
MLAGDLFSQPGSIEPTIQTQVEISIQDNQQDCDHNEGNENGKTCEDTIAPLDSIVTLSDFTFDGDINKFNFYGHGQSIGDGEPPTSSVPPTVDRPDNPTTINQTTNQNEISDTPSSPNSPEFRKISISEVPNQESPRLLEPVKIEASLISLTGESVESLNYDPLILNISHQNYFHDLNLIPAQVDSSTFHSGLIDHYQVFSVIDVESVISEPVDNSAVAEKDHRSFDSKLALRLLAKIENQSGQNASQEADSVPPTNDLEKLTEFANQPNFQLRQVSFEVSMNTPEAFIDPRYPEVVQTPKTEVEDVSTRLDKEFEGDPGDPIPVLETAAALAFLVANRSLNQSDPAEDLPQKGS